MPVIAIAGAVGAWALGGATALGAIAAGTATVMDALIVVGAVGATMSAVGVVTKDKGLTTAGMVLGGIGGIGALAVSAGAFGLDAATPLFGSETAAAGGVGSTAAAGAGQAAAPAAGQAAATADNVINSLAQFDAAPEAAAPAIDPLAMASGAAPSGGLINAPVAASVTPDIAASIPSTLATPDVATAPPGFFSNLMKSPYAQYGMIQAAGSLVSGLFDPLKPAQVEALDAQAAQNRAATAVTNLQLTNQQQPLPKATLNKPQVTGAPASLINSPPPGPVTGTVSLNQPAA